METYKTEIVIYLVSVNFDMENNAEVTIVICIQLSLQLPRLDFLKKELMKMNT